MKTCVLAIFFLALSSSASFGADFVRPAAWKNIQKIVIVVLENTKYEVALQQPFLQKLAESGALLKDFHGVTHPSQPNYIALVSGSTHKVSTDNNVDLDKRHVGDLLEAAGKSWKTYAEGYPGHGFLDARKGKYVRKHVPFLSFKNVQSSPERLANIVDGWHFFADHKFNTLPTFSMLIPDLDNDGHDTSVERASYSMNTFLGSMINDFELMQNTLLVVTFDEDDKTFPFTNHIYTAFVGAGVNPGTESSTSYNHYNLLRTVEEIFELGTLGKEDQKALPILDIWQPDGLEQGTL